MAINATPLTLADNLFETVALYPGHQISFNTEVAGHEGYHIADGLRDLTWWGTPSSLTDPIATVQCDEPRPADMLVLDRGHNHIGKNVIVAHSADGVAWTNVLFETPGVNGTVTAEGAWWTTFPEQDALWWRVQLFAFAPDPGSLLLPGLWLGKSLRFKNYLHRPVDSDRTRLEREERVTEGGVRVRSREVAYRELADRLTLYDEAEYTAGVRKWVTQITRGGVPFWWCLDSTNHPAEMWQFLNQATEIAWAFEQAKGRTGRIEALENIPRRSLVYL